MNTAGPHFLRWLCAFTIAAAALSPAPASATLTLQMTEFVGGGVVTCADDDVAGCDLAPGLGILAFNGPVGTFQVNIVTLLSKPLVGGPGLAQLNLNTLNVVGTETGALFIQASDIDYSLPAGLASFRSAIDGTFDGPAGSFLLPLQCVSLDNVPLTDCDVSLVHGPFDPNPGPFLDAKTKGLVLGGPFALTEQLVINLTGPGSSSVRFDSQVGVGVSEPTVLLLLGTGLTALSSVPRWRRRGRARAARL